jgi:hypothetical protein
LSKKIESAKLIAMTPKLLAQVDIGRDFKINPTQGISGPSQFQTIGGLISTILPNLYVAAGLILLFFLIFGGVMVILGAGKGESQQAEQGKKIVTRTLIGFLIIFLSYWIIRIIEIITGVKILSSPL